ncbi:MAG: tetratricopeptide repeat protein, partial [Bacteroidota bacterium]
YAYNATSKFGEAIDQYRKALELNPKSYDTNIQIGLAFQNLKNFPKARDYYTNALQLDPEDQTAIEFMQRLDEIQKKYQWNPLLVPSHTPTILVCSVVKLKFKRKTRILDILVKIHFEHVDASEVTEPQ